MSAFRNLNDLYRVSHLLADPGNGGTITANQDLLLCELVSVGADETRTLAVPTKPGIRFCVRMKTDGGDIYITSANGINVALETVAIFEDVGDLLWMISVSADSGYRWEVIVNTGSVPIPSSSISSSASSSISSSISSSPSSSISSSPSSSISSSVSSSAS